MAVIHILEKSAPEMLPGPSSKSYIIDKLRIWITSWISIRFLLHWKIKTFRRCLLINSKNIRAIYNVTDFWAHITLEEWLEYAKKLASAVFFYFYCCRSIRFLNQNYILLMFYGMIKCRKQFRCFPSVIETNLTFTYEAGFNEMIVLIWYPRGSIRHVQLKFSDCLI